MPKKKYEIFISFKDLDNESNRTVASRLAEKIYDSLDVKKYNAFFSRYVLPGMAGEEYKPEINYALESAKLLVIVFSNAEEVNSEWVKYEWKYFLKHKKPILTVFKGCGKANRENMPQEIKKLEYIDLTDDTSGKQYDFMLKRIDEIMRRGKFFFGKRHPRPKKNSSHSPLPAPKKPQERGKRSESSSSYALEKEMREKKRQEEVGAGDLLALISQLENRKNKNDGALTNKYAKESVNGYTDSSLDKPTGISLHIKPAKLVEKFMRFMDFDDWLIKFMKAETNIMIIFFILAVVFNHDGDFLKITSLELIQSSINNSTSIVESTYVDAFYDFSMIGNKMMFGQYPQGANGEIMPLEWRVLDVRDGKVLLITDKLIDVIPFNIEFTDITWETCTLRKWLNNEFVNKAFSNSQQTQIENVFNLTPDSALWGSEGGNPTHDKVFLLSIDEVDNYFRNNDDRMAVVTEYAKEKGARILTDKDIEEYGLNITFPNGAKTGNWWLRSPGELDLEAAYVDELGFINQTGTFVCFDYIAVRPALWLNLR